MDNKQNKYIAVSYQLYAIETNGEKQLVEETDSDRPFKFITGFGFSLDGFEQHIEGLQAGEKFDFTLSPADAFGDYYEEGVRKLAREMFCINGKFDSTNVYPDAVITLTDTDDKRFMARVTKVEADGVTVDTNHPLAGKSLQFTGDVLESREATAEEIQTLINRMSHECGGCGGCGSCGGDCDSDCGGCHNS